MITFILILAHKFERYDMQAFNFEVEYIGIMCGFREYAIEV